MAVSRSPLGAFEGAYDLMISHEMILGQQVPCGLLVTLVSCGNGRMGKLHCNGTPSKVGAGSSTLTRPSSHTFLKELK